MKSLARNTYSLQVFPVCFKTYSSTCRISIITLISRIFLYNFEGQIFTISTIWGSIFPLLRFFSLWSCSICDLIWPKFYLPPKTGSLSFAFYCTSLPLYNGSGPFCEPFNSLTRKVFSLPSSEAELCRNPKGMTASTRWAAEYTALSREHQKRQKRFFLKGDIFLEQIDLWNHSLILTELSIQTLFTKGKDRDTFMPASHGHSSLSNNNKHSLSGHESSYLYIISSNPSFCKDGRFWRRNKEKKPFIM